MSTVDASEFGTTILPSEGQSGIWIQDRLKAQDAYHVTFAYRLGGMLDVGRLRAALTASVEAHEAFRTVFREVEGELVGLVASDPAPFDLAQERTTAALVEARLQEIWRTRFDLAADRLVRAHLLDVDGDHFVLSITVHHIVFDDWSMGLWLDEVADLYRRPRAVQSDGAAMAAHRQWAAARRTSAAHRANLDSAVALLDDAPERLDLPRANAEPSAARVWDGGAAEALLDRSVADRVRAVARENGCTEYVVYLAAWTTLVSMYAQHDDITVGTPVADRLGPGADALVGYFLNTAVVRHRVRHDVAFVEVLASARDAFYAGIEYADVAYEEIARRVAGRREDPSAPLFATWFALDGGTSDLSLDEVDVARIDVPTTTAKFELALFVSLMDGGPRLAIEYASALYTADAVGSMLGHYQRLLEIVTESPQIRVRDIDVLSDGERVQLERWGRLAAAVEAPQHLASAFAHTALREQQTVALEHGDVRVSYAELKAMADRVAARLEVAGVRAGDVVGVSVARSPAMVAAVLGVLTVGAAYVALEPTYPTARLQHMVADSGLSVVLVDPAAADRIASLGVTTIEATAAADTRSPALFDAGAHPTASLAYVTYTSGSTGAPKGIRMSHAAVWNLVGWQQQHYASIGRGHRTLQFAALSFDVSAQEIFGTLCSGGILVLIDQQERDAVHNVMAVVRDRRVERVFMAAPALLEAVESAVALGVVPDSLRVIVSGSEQLVVTSSLRTFASRLRPDARWFNEYGPSETHVATMYEAPADPADWPTWMPIGRPIGGTEVRLLDANGRRTPPGSVGEICLAGPGLADGYSGLPGVTARAFVPDPYGARPGARLYRTGDVARYLADGVLEFLGRRDTQVKIRGFRIELEEIRAVLDAAPQVAQSFVGVTGGAGGSEICAFWVRNVSTSGPDASAGVWQHLHAQLPAYMIPARLVEVSAFPLTAHGKVDQRALLATLAEDETPTHSPTPEPTGDPLARAIAAAMAGVLGRESLGEHDDFFALGGQSLLANRLVWTLEAEQIASVSLRAVFDGRTPVGVASLAGPPKRPRATPAPHAESVADRLASLLDEIGSSDRDGSTAESRA